MRIFVGIDLPAEIRERIAAFARDMSALAPDVRFVHPDTFHVTLKFIGEVSPARVDSLRAALRGVRVREFPITFRNTGFFPTRRAPRVFWVGIEAGSELAELAAHVDGVCANFGVMRETQPYRPHLTLARSGSGRPQRGRKDAPNLRFARLHERLAAIPAPEFGTMTATEFFLYESKLSPRGAQYSKLDRFVFTGNSAAKE